jgi:hypothetical protein
MSTSQQQKQKTTRPSTATIAGGLLVIVGICGFIDSYLILASLIVWGWLIVGAIGFFTLMSGIGLISGADWAWSAGSTLAILNLFIGFIELIGAFNYHYAVLGWVGIGQAVGVVTLLVSAVSLYLLYRKEVRDYYNQYETIYTDDPYFNRYGYGVW